MKLTPNQRSVLSELAAGQSLTAAEIARRSGRQHLPGVIRVLESLRQSGLISRLDGPVTWSWQAAEQRTGDTPSCALDAGAGAAGPRQRG